MLQLAKGNARYAAQIRECWAFDAANIGSVDGWPDWARSHRQAALYLYSSSYFPSQQLCKNLVGTSRPNGAPVKCTPNVFAWKSSVGHDDVPARYLKDRIQGAQFLHDKGNCPSHQTRERR
jgi:hypothetical protein